MGAAAEAEPGEGDVMHGHTQPPVTEEQKREIRREMEAASRDELVEIMRTPGSKDRMNFERATAARGELFGRRLRMPKGTDIIGNGKPVGGSR